MTHCVRVLISLKNTSSPKAFLFDTTSKLYVATDASPVDRATHNLCCDYLHMLTSFGPLYKCVASSTHQPLRSHLDLRSNPSPEPVSPATASSSSSSSPSTSAPSTTSKAPFYPSASTSLSPSQPVTLTYHLVTPHLALVASLPTPVFEMRRGLVEWNVVWFRQGAREIWEVEKERSEGEMV